MTADWFASPRSPRHHFNRIINEVRGINRVVYDISSKPPPPSSGNDRRLTQSGCATAGSGPAVRVAGKHFEKIFLQYRARRLV